MTREPPLRASTSQVDSLPFSPHGKVDIWREGDLHLYEATGPFNKELVDSLAIAQADFLRAAQQNTPWVSICIVRNSALATPDSLQRYGELIRQAPPPLTPLATAYVIGPDVEGGQLMAPHFVRVFAQAGRLFQTFATLDEARRWAQGLIDQARGA